METHRDSRYFRVGSAGGPTVWPIFPKLFLCPVIAIAYLLSPGDLDRSPAVPYDSFPSVIQNHMLVASHRNSVRPSPWRGLIHWPSVPGFRCNPPCGSYYAFKAIWSAMSAMQSYMIQKQLQRFPLLACQSAPTARPYKQLNCQC